jgi:hypothetical protein
MAEVMGAGGLIRIYRWVVARLFGIEHKKAPPRKEGLGWFVCEVQLALL